MVRSYGFKCLNLLQMINHTQKKFVPFSEDFRLTSTVVIIDAFGRLGSQIPLFHALFYKREADTVSSVKTDYRIEAVKIEGLDNTYYGKPYAAISISSGVAQSFCNIS
jgi:hypothetical protein